MENAVIIPTLPCVCFASTVCEVVLHGCLPSFRHAGLLLVRLTQALLDHDEQEAKLGNQDHAVPYSLTTVELCMRMGVYNNSSETCRPPLGCRRCHLYDGESRLDQS